MLKYSKITVWRDSCPRSHWMSPNRAKLFKILAGTFSKNRLSIKSLWEAYFIETLLKLLESAVFQISKNASHFIKRWLNWKEKAGRVVHSMQQQPFCILLHLYYQGALDKHWSTFWVGITFYCINYRARDSYDTEYSGSTYTIKHHDMKFYTVPWENILILTNVKKLALTKKGCHSYIM